MIEVEMKFPVDDAAELARKVQELGGRDHGSRAEVDHYFNAPDRDFAQTDEALRLRQVGERNILTYKGPKLDAETKTRTEIEVALEEGPAAAEQARHLLQALGYRPVAVLRKQRTPFALQSDGQDVELSLDEVEGIGLYAELEIVTSKELDAARKAVQNLARQLGLTHSERRSYLELWLQKHSPNADR